MSKPDPSKKPKRQSQTGRQVMRQAISASVKYAATAGQGQQTPKAATVIDIQHHLILSLNCFRQNAPEMTAPNRINKEPIN
jgi:hypothetical protein